MTATGRVYVANVGDITQSPSAYSLTVTANLGEYGTVTQNFTLGIFRMAIHTSNVQSQQTQDGGQAIMKARTMKLNRKLIATTTTKRLVHYGVLVTVGTTLLLIWKVMDMVVRWSPIYTLTGTTPTQTTCLVTMVTALWADVSDNNWWCLK